MSVQYSSFFLIFYGLQLFLAVAVRRPIPRTAHLRDCSTGSIGYSYEVRPTFQVASMGHFTHTLHYPYTTHYRPATVKAVYAILYSPEASLLQVVATHLTLNHGFPIIRLSQPGAA